MTKISTKSTGAATVRKCITANSNQPTKPPQAVLDGLSATADRFMEAAQSEASKCAYASDIRMFAASGITVPATAAQVIEYLAQFAGKLSVATLERRLISLHKAHLGVVRPNPRNFPLLGLPPVNPRQNRFQVNRIALVSECIVTQEMQMLPRRW